MPQKQHIVNASWYARPLLPASMFPKLGVVIVLTGVLKFTWFITLNASPRKVKVLPSVILNALCSAAS